MPYRGRRAEGAQVPSPDPESATGEGRVQPRAILASRLPYSSLGALPPNICCQMLGLRHHLGFCPCSCLSSPETHRDFSANSLLEGEPTGHEQGSRDRTREGSCMGTWGLARDP